MHDSVVLTLYPGIQSALISWCCSPLIHPPSFMQVFHRWTCLGHALTSQRSRLALALTDPPSRQSFSLVLGLAWQRPLLAPVLLARAWVGVAKTPPRASPSHSCLGWRGKRRSAQSVLVPEDRPRKHEAGHPIALGGCSWAKHGSWLASTKRARSHKCGGVSSQPRLAEARALPHLAIWR